MRTRILPALIALGMWVYPAASRGAQPAAEPGLVGEYFAGGTEIAEGAKPFYVKIDKQLDFQETSGNFAKSKLSENFAVRWTGVLRVEKPGAYTFYGASDDGSRITIGDKTVVDHWGMHARSEKSGTIELTAGDHPIRVDYQQGGGGAACTISWKPPGGQKEILPAGVLFHAKEAANIAYDAEAWGKHKAKFSGKTDLNSPWGRMNYGPFLSHTIGAPSPSDNVTLKGVAVKLSAGGEAKGGVLFDTQLMRVSAGWTGDFLTLKGVSFDGSHGPNPDVGGDVKFGTSQGPGWARPGTTDFTDPRPEPFGPLPKDWLQHRGLYAHGDRVVFAYTVGGTDVLETHAAEPAGDERVFTRTFRVAPSKEPMTMLVAETDGGDGKVAGLDVVKPADFQWPKAGPAGANVAILTSGDTNVAAGLVGGPDGAAWEIGRAGNRPRIALTLPPHDQPLTFTLVLWGGDKADAPAFKQALAAGREPVNFDALTTGGPARYPQTVEVKGVLGDQDPQASAEACGAAYVVDTIPVPEKNPYDAWIRFGGFDFFDGGTSAALSTWSGDVWVVSGIDEKLDKLTWRRFASGLFQPLGLKIVDGVVHVHGRDAITRLHDLNADGEADFYENLNNDVTITPGFHEFSFDLHTDPAGDFYFIKGGPVNPGGGGFSKLVRHHGALMKLSKDGSTLSTVATGFRAPNGMGVGPDGQLTSGDNQGSWTPQCRLNWIKPGGFYGVVDLAQRDTPPTATENPLCWIPHSWDNSSGAQAWVPPGDKWGPFGGDLLHLSYGQCRLFKVMKEEVDGEVQGGVVAFGLKFESGIMRARFNPADGQLYLCGLRGWQTSAAKDACFQRVRYTGKPVHMPRDLRVKPNGLEITFTQPLDPETANDAGSYGVERWNYRWTSGYGSSDFSVKNRDQQGHDTVEVKSAKLAADGKTVFLELAEPVVPCMQMQVNYSLDTADGEEMTDRIVLTVNAVPGGGKLVVSTDKPAGEVKK